MAGYWRRLVAALLGRDANSREVFDGDAGEAELHARVSSLELDLRERDERIEKMRSEYETLKMAKERVAAGAGREEVAALFKKLAGPMANLAALTSMAEAGQDVAAPDLMRLIKGLEKELARAGLEPVGKAGDETTFDVALHQRMSGGSVHAGTPVTVRLGGYRMGEKVLLKAMVSTREE